MAMGKGLLEAKVLLMKIPTILIMATSLGNG